MRPTYLRLKHGPALLATNFSVATMGMVADIRTVAASVVFMQWR
jgi:hypothetical protein